MGFDPFIQISFIKSPAFIEPHLAQSIADNLLFEAVAREAAILGGFIEVENAFASTRAGQRFFQVIRYGSRESWEIDEIGCGCLHLT